MFTALYQVAKNTFREALREPIFLLVLLSALVLIGLYPLCTMFVFRAEQRLIVDSAMATTMIFGWGVAILIASYAISREIDNGTALLLLSKPVQRPVFIIAKILGILGAVTVFWFLAAVGTLISLRTACDQFWIDMPLFWMYFVGILLAFAVAGIHNYVAHSSFPMVCVIALCVTMPLVAVVAQFKSTNGETTGLSWHVIPALVLILYSVWAMASLATTLSTRFNLVSNLLLCSVLFLVGLMSDYLIGRFERQPWFDSVPRGQGYIWMAQYDFAPTEMGVKKWNKPVKVDTGDEPFVVWSDKENPGDLSDQGSNAAATWKDGQGWKNKVDDLDDQPYYMATYDSVTHKWDKVRIRRERDAVSKEAKGLEAKFTSHVFRRSVNPPVTPSGGTYDNPLPAGGSFFATALYAVIPNWQLFWMADALAINKSIPTAYLAYGAVYAILMIAFLMVLAVALFGNREVGKQIIT
ncbi:MAG: ABC transporter permease [Victivallales bacterium]|nr:ABC transporter permease [Victivallales bacterium]